MAGAASAIFNVLLLLPADQFRLANGTKKMGRLEVQGPDGRWGTVRREGMAISMLHINWGALRRAAAALASLSAVQGGCLGSPTTYLSISLVALLQVCRRGFDNVAAAIVCKQLGLPLPGRAIAGPNGAGVFGRGSGPIWMDEISCWRNESRLEQCQFAGWGKSACDHSQDVGVACGSEGAPHSHNGCGQLKVV